MLLVLASRSSHRSRAIVRRGTDGQQALGGFDAGLLDACVTAAGIREQLMQEIAVD